MRQYNLNGKDVTNEELISDLDLGEREIRMRREKSATKALIEKAETTGEMQILTMEPGVDSMNTGSVMVIAYSNGNISNGKRLVLMIAKYLLSIGNN